MQGFHLVPVAVTKCLCQPPVFHRIPRTCAANELRLKQKPRRPRIAISPLDQQHRSGAIIRRQRKQQPPAWLQRIQPHRQRRGRARIHIQHIACRHRPLRPVLRMQGHLR